MLNLCKFENIDKIKLKYFIKALGGFKFMANLEAKETVIKKFQVHDKDQGSSEVQIALLTNRINHLVEHLKKINETIIHVED